MTKFKKIAILGAVVLTIGAFSLTSFAQSIYKTPAEAAAGLTGKTVESVIAERQETGKSYGAIAGEAGKLEEFKAENIQIKKDALEARVAAGTLTRERADEIIKALEANVGNCDGTGTDRVGQGYGAGFGGGCGNGNGNGNGYGRGQGGGCGMGCGQGADLD